MTEEQLRGWLSQPPSPAMQVAGVKATETTTFSNYIEYVNGIWRAMVKEKLRELK